MNKELMAIVAEYRGVAIIERDGTKRAVWKGTEYRTDGLSYLMVPPHDGLVGLVPFESEAKIKELLDMQLEEELRQWCSYEEAHRIICHSEPQDKPTFRWDETQQVFIK
jgi:hypothetical protein